MSEGASWHTSTPPGPSRASWGALALLGVAAVIALASFTLRRGPERMSVRAVESATRTVRSQVRAQGKVRARRQVEVTSEVAGRVTEVFVRLGDRVEAGAPLFALDDDQLANARAQLGVAHRAANAMLARAQLMHTEARRALERERTLHEKRVLPEENVRAAEARVELADADVEQARAGLERARLELLRADDALARSRVVAPLAGVVVDVSLEVGQVVAPVGAMSSAMSVGAGGMGGFGAASGSVSGIVIADLSELVARLEVDELDIGRVRVGQPVRLSALSGASPALWGWVTEVALLGRDVGGAVSFAVEARVLAPDAGAAEGTASTPETNPEATLAARAGVGLRPGMTVAAEIEVERLPDAVALPVAAVLEGDGQPGGEPDRVWVLASGADETEVQLREVLLGATDQELVAVLSGLAAGERVVEGPFRALRELAAGDAVVVEKTVELPASDAPTPPALPPAALPPAAQAPAP